MKRDKVINRALSIFFTILSLAWIYPVFMIALNSFKKGTAISTTTAFDLLTPETFNGLANYVHALNEQGFASASMYSLIITVTSVVLILVCCSMCAWYVVRVNNKISNFFYYLFVFSMVVPFQMLMFTLSNLADRIASTRRSTSALSTLALAQAWRSLCSRLCKEHPARDRGGGHDRRLQPGPGVL